MLDGKTVFVTGTNRGLGKVILKACAEAGANVIAHARMRTDEFLHDCAHVASACHVSVEPVFFDLSDLSAIDSAVRPIVKSKTPVHGLVNSAGIGFWSYFQLMPMEKVQELLGVNLLGPMQLTQCLFRSLSRQGASIVNIASIAGIDLRAGNCAYGVSKAALIAFTKSLAAESGQFRVRANAIAPGLMLTDMGRAMGGKEEESAMRATAMGRLCTPEDVAKATVFLLSDKSDYINGQVIEMDGGKK